ncbi:toprim domain-containing protein [bacterium]|nr:toprim domain-containing protein [bacterium]
MENLIVDNIESNLKRSNETIFFNNLDDNYVSCFSDSLNKILDRLEQVKSLPNNEYTALCPSHDDKHPSLSITEQDGKILMYCHAGCVLKDIVNSIGLTMSDLFPLSSKKRQQKKIEEVIYDYVDEEDILLYQTVRSDGKTFRQRRPDGNGGYFWNLRDVRRVLYHLPNVIQGISNQETIYICEGEKDADNLAKLNFVTTTSPMGAGKWREDYTESLKGCCQAVIIADKDKPGREHAKTVAEQLHKAGIPVKVIELPNLNGKQIKDFSDWLSAGGMREDFLDIVDKSDIWKPSEQNHDKKLSSELDSLIQKFGSPFYTGKNGKITGINQNFWAGAHNCENIQLYEPDDSVFYRYNAENGLYAPISMDKIKTEISTKILEVSKVIDEPSLEKYRTNPTLNHITALLKGIGEKKDAFRHEKKIIHVANGVIVFNEKDDFNFCKFSPEFFSRNQCPIKYNPSARCDKFLNDFLYPAVSEDDALLIQKYTGLSLLGSNLIQRFLILDGQPGRGKSTLSLIIQSLVGQENISELRTKHLSERFEIYRYLKKQLLVGVDVPGNFLTEKGAQIIKGLVGGDYFDAEQKGGTGNFPIRGDFCILITSNSRLRVRLDGDVDAWKRRLLIIRFNTTTPPKKIPNFSNLLIKEEGSGILNWALQGLGVLLKEIDKYGDIYLTDSQDSIVDSLLAESDSLRYFLKEKVVKDKAGDLSTDEIVKAYNEYCPDKGWDPKPITVVQRELESLMLELFQTTKANSITRNDKSCRGFRYVSFKENT